MKVMFQRTLALVCVSALLLCCMVGITFGVVATPSEAYSDWPLFFSAEGREYNFESGKKVLLTIMNAGVDLPDTASMKTTALYIRMAVDAPAVTALTKSQTELCNNTCDQAELDWNNISCKVGDNELLLPLSEAGHLAGTLGKGFDLTAPINYFRIYTDNLLTANSTVTLYEVGLVDTNEAGLTFGADDTYLQLSEALEETPNTIEASIKMEPLSQDTGNWTVVPMDGSVSGLFRESITPTYKTVESDTENSPPVGTRYASVVIGKGTNGNGSGLFKFYTGFDAAIPRSYDNEADLSLAFWLYTPTGSMPAGYLEVTSSGKWDEQEISWKAQNLSLTEGWNYVVLPFNSATNRSGAAFVPYNANYIRWYTNENAAFTTDTEICISDIKIVASPDTTPAPENTTVDASASNYMIFSNTNSTDANPLALLVTKDNELAVIWGDKQFTAEGDYDLRTGEWVDVAVVRDMTQNKFLFYVDGVLVDDADATGTTDIIPTVAHCIGSDGAGINGGLFEGAIADVRVWSDVRTAVEIEAGRVEKKGNTANDLTATTEGLINSWFMMGKIQYVTKTLPDTMGQNPLVYRGSRADHWLDYDKTQYNFLYNAEGEEDYYSIVFIPDIQNLNAKYNEAWYTIAQWIADNVEEENIQHVMNAGDNTWNDHVSEWAIARAGYDLFTDKVSWNSLTGNHDYARPSTRRNTTNYQTYLGEDYIQSTAAKNTFVEYFQDPYGLSTVENAYYRFSVNGINWMILQLEYFPRTHVVEWADEVLKAHPYDNVILTTHGYLNGTSKDFAAHREEDYITDDPTTGGLLGSTTASIWNTLVYPNTNVTMVLCGHSRTSDGSILVKETENKAGVAVPQLMINAQDEDLDYFSDEPLAMVSIFRFSADGKNVALQYYSPYHDKSFDPVGEDITLTLNLVACAHTETKHYDEKKATCTAPGRVAGVWCTVCENYVSGGETIPVQGHTKQTIPAVAPTCTATGLTAGAKCTVCGDTLTAQEVVSATGHAWDEGKITTEATAGMDGVMTHTCLGCGDTREEPIPATGLLGDADGNGEITSTDARLVLQYYVQKITAEDLNTALVDVDGNGEITSTDARLILQYYVKKISAFPAS